MQEEEDRKNGLLLPQIIARKTGGGPLGLKHNAPSTHNTSVISAGTEDFDPNQSLVVGSIKQGVSPS